MVDGRGAKRKTGVGVEEKTKMGKGGRKGGTMFPASR